MVIQYQTHQKLTNINSQKEICEKMGSPQKARRKKSKPGWEIRLETQMKKSTKTGQDDKTKENAGTRGDEKEKSNTRKISIQLEENNQKVLTKEGRLKRYRQRVKQYRQNRTFQNNERKFYQQLGGDDTKTYQQPDARETKRF